jgi:hypothetical protein
MIHRLFAVSISAALILLSPGLGCWEAAAQALRSAPIDAGFSGGPGAPAPLTADSMSGGMPTGTLGLDTLDSIDSMASMNGMQTAEAGAMSAARGASPAGQPGQARARLQPASLPETLGSRSGRDVSAPISSVQTEVRKLIESAPSAASASGEAASGHGEALFRALVRSKASPLAPLASSLAVEPSAALPTPARMLNAASDRGSRVSVSGSKGPQEPKRADLSGRLTAFAITVGLPGWLLTYPMLAPFIHAGMLVSFAAVPAVLFAAAHLSIASMTLMSDKTPRFIRALPGVLLLKTGLLLALVGGGAALGAQGLTSLISGNAVYGVALAASSWGLLHAATGSENDRMFRSQWRMFYAYAGSLASLAGAGVLLLGRTGFLPSTAVFLGVLGMIDLSFYAPGGIRKVPALFSLLPIVFLALPMLHFGVWPIAAAIALTSLAPASALYLKESAGRWRRSIPPALVALSGVGAYLFGLAPATMIFSILGALGLRQQLMREPYSNESDASDRYLIKDEPDQMMALYATALVAASWLQVLAISGPLAAFVTYGSFALATVGLIPRIHKSVEGALKQAAKGVGRSVDGFGSVLFNWYSRSELLSNLRAYSKRKLDNSWWNGVPLLFLWAPIVLLMGADGLASLALGLVGGTLRAVPNALLGAFRAVKADKPTRFMQAYVDATYDLLEGGSSENFEPWVSGKVRGLLAGGGLSAAGGLAASHAAVLAWLVRSIVVALAAPFIALYRAIRSMPPPAPPSTLAPGQKLYEELEQLIDSRPEVMKVAGLTGIAVSVNTEAVVRVRLDGSVASEQVKADVLRILPELSAYRFEFATFGKVIARYRGIRPLTPEELTAAQKAVEAVGGRVLDMSGAMLLVEGDVGAITAAISQLPTRGWTISPENNDTRTAD